MSIALGIDALAATIFVETLGVDDGVKVCAIGVGVAAAAVTPAGGFCAAFGALETGSGTFDDCGLVFASVGFRHIKLSPKRCDRKSAAGCGAPRMRLEL